MNLLCKFYLDYIQIFTYIQIWMGIKQKRNKQNHIYIHIHFGYKTFTILGKFRAQIQI